MLDYVVEDVFYSRVRAIALKTPGNSAVECNGREITYEELLEQTDRCAMALSELGVRYGDRVAFMAPPRPEVIIVLLACSRLGATFAGLGLRLQGEDLKYILDDAAPRIIFAPDSLDGRKCADEIEALLPDGSDQQVVRLSIQDDNGIAPEFEAFIAGAEGRDVPVSGHPDTPLAIIYTSGSTGKPKGAEITNLAVLTSVSNALRRIDIADVRALSLLPIDHVAFLANELVMVLLSGGAAVQISRFDVCDVLETIEKKKITLWCAIPTMLQRIATSGRIDDFDLSSLEYLWWPGPLSEQAFQIIRGKAKRLGVSYGMTEAAGGITFSDPDTPQERLLHTVGRVLPSLEMKLDDVDVVDGREIGEILIRGKQLITEYWNRPDATSAAFTEDGWFRTGDLGALDGDYLSIVGRKKELIRSGGYNISPYEIEAAIESHPAVDFAIVVGVRDEEYGEAVVGALSFVKGQTAEVEDIRSHVRAKLPGYKVPKHLSTQDGIPFLANGKVDRNLLKKQLGEVWTEICKERDKV